MAANVETMFCVKEPAWHGLGTVVKEAPTSQEAIRIAGLDWTVERCPIFLKGGKEIPDRIANVRSSDRSVLGITGIQYKVVQNQEAFDFVDSLLESKEITFESAGSLDHGKRIWLLANLPSQKILGEEIVPYLVFSNTHDGSRAVTAAMTPVRVVCQNTLNLALAKANRTWTIRHIGDIQKKKQEAVTTLELATKYMTVMEEKAEQLQQISISPKKLNAILEAIYPVSKDASERLKRNNQQLRDSFLSIYNFQEDLKSFKGSGWGVYNAFADQVSHMVPLRQTDTYKEKRFASLVDGNSLLFKVQSVLQKAA